MKSKTPAVEYNKRYTQCIVAAACITGACFSLLFAPVVNYSKNDGSIAGGVALSVITWAFVLSASVLVQKISRFAVREAGRDKSYAGERYKKRKSGLIVFASNYEGLGAEILLLAGIIIWILRGTGVVFLSGSVRMLQYSMTFSGFLLHWFFNGKNYIYIKSKAKKK